MIKKTNNLLPNSLTAVINRRGVTGHGSLRYADAVRWKKLNLLAAFTASKLHHEVTFLVRLTNRLSWDVDGRRSAPGSFGSPCCHHRSSGAFYFLWEKHRLTSACQHLLAAGVWSSVPAKSSGTPQVFVAVGSYHVRALAYRRDTFQKI